MYEQVDRSILNLFSDMRKQMLEVIDGLDHRQWSEIPKGFRNHVHWQIGHVLTVTDELIFAYSGMGSKLSADYKSYFAPGTSPEQWLAHPPKRETIVDLLKVQMQDINQQFVGKMTQPVADPNNFLQASTVIELFHVLLAHEGIHVGMIRAMVNVLQNNLNEAESEHDG